MGVDEEGATAAWFYALSIRNSDLLLEHSIWTPFALAIGRSLLLFTNLGQAKDAGGRLEDRGVQ